MFHLNPICKIDYHLPFGMPSRKAGSSITGSNQNIDKPSNLKKKPASQMYYVEFDYCKINQIKWVTHWHGLNSTSPCVVNRAFALLEYVTLAANSSTHVHTYFAQYAAFGGCDYRNAVHVFWDYQISCFLYITSELHSTSFLPEASYGLRILLLSACVCVCQSRACPHDNFSTF